MRNRDLPFSENKYFSRVKKSMTRKLSPCGLLRYLELSYISKSVIFKARVQKKARSESMGRHEARPRPYVP